MIDIREVDFGSEEHRACVALRREFLRLPLGLDFSADELEAEVDDRHLGAFDGARCVGVLVLTRLNSETVKMRQVAVHPDYQRQGIGEALVSRSEALARPGRMVLNARETAVRFYTKLGYELEGEPFTEVGIPHRRMAKQLL